MKTKVVGEPGTTQEPVKEPVESGEILRTKHARCPECGGNVLACDFRDDKGD